MFKKKVSRLLNYPIRKAAKIVYALPVKEDGWNQLRLIHFFLNYVDCFYLFKTKTYSLMKVMAILSLTKKITFLKLLYKMEAYAGIDIDDKMWGGFSSFIERNVGRAYSRQARIKFIECSVEVLLTDSFYGKSSRSAGSALHNIKKILEYLELPESCLEVERYVLGCAEYTFSITDSIPKLPEVDSAIEAWQLLLLERVSAMLGFLASSNVFREKAKTLLVYNALENESFLSKAKAKMAFFAAVENYDYESAKRIIAKTRTKDMFFLKVMSFMYYLFVGDKVYEKYFKVLCRGEERRFADFIADKTVAIVAPLPVQSGSGEDIDAHDYVLRMGALGHPIDLDPKKYGSRTDIGSFNVMDLQSSKYTKSGKLVIGRELKYLVFKNLKKSKFKGEVVDTPLVRKRTLQGGVITLNNYTNHVPELVLFLLGSGAKIVSLYSMNFFMSKATYVKSYRDLPSAHTLYYAGDNLIIGHRYLKRLYELGLIHCDESAREVIELSTEQYMQNMENLYRDTIRFKSK
ncbi:MAG: hypothetical protein ITG07_11015 [Candidimonas sp.]|nr:hypothetical protein [Candidimonas sp.]